MSFLFRALVTIGLLSYFAAERRDVEALTGAVSQGKGASDIAAMIAAMPAETREAVLQAGASEAAKRLASARLSEDTLSETDRRLPWRGSQSR